MRHDFRSARLVRACALVTLIASSYPAVAAPVQQESGSDVVARELLDQIERTTYSPAEAGVEVLYAEFVGRIVNFPGSVQDLVYHGEAVWTPASGFKVRMDADAEKLDTVLRLVIGGAQFFDIEFQIQPFDPRPRLETGDRFGFRLMANLLCHERTVARDTVLFRLHAVLPHFPGQFGHPVIYPANTA